MVLLVLLVHQSTCFFVLAFCEILFYHLQFKLHICNLRSWKFSLICVAACHSGWWWVLTPDQLITTALKHLQVRVIKPKDNHPFFPPAIWNPSVHFIWTFSCSLPLHSEVWNWTNKTEIFHGGVKFVQSINAPEKKFYKICILHRLKNIMLLICQTYFFIQKDFLVP